MKIKSIYAAVISNIILYSVKYKILSFAELDNIKSAFLIVICIIKFSCFIIKNTIKPETWSAVFRVTTSATHVLHVHLLVESLRYTIQFEI